MSDWTGAVSDTARFYAAADAAGRNDREDITAGSGLSRYDEQNPNPKEARHGLE